MQNPYAKSLRYSIYDGCCHAVMLGIGETYFMVFAIALGMSSFSLGALAAVPILLGSFLQLLILDRIVLVHSRRKITTALAFAQAFLLLLLFWMPLIFSNSQFLIFVLLLVIYHACVHVISPLWNSWMGDIVPVHERGVYFGKRNKYRSIFELAAFLAGGIILHEMVGVGHYVGFGIIFSIAFIARFISTIFLHGMEEPEYHVPGPSQYFSFLTFLRKSPTNNYGRFVIFIFCIFAASNVASPFFAVYMLRGLNFSYLQLTITLAIPLIFQVFSFQAWGYIGDRFGNRQILDITCFGAAIVPLLWLSTDNFIAILFFQAFSGMVWAGFNLAAINFIFDAVTPNKLQRCTTFYNFMGNIGIFLGALTGGFLSKVGVPWVGVAGYSQTDNIGIFHFLFLLSGLLRFFVWFWFRKKIHEVKEVQHDTSWHVIRHFIGMSLVPEFGTRFINVFLRSRKIDTDLKR